MPRGWKESQQGYSLNDIFLPVGCLGAGTGSYGGVAIFLSRLHTSAVWKVFLFVSTRLRRKLRDYTGVFASSIKDFHIWPSRKRRFFYSLFFLLTFVRQTLIYLPFFLQQIRLAWVAMTPVFWKMSTDYKSRPQSVLKALNLRAFL